jgi:hypothetical protein
VQVDHAVNTRLARTVLPNRAAQTGGAGCFNALQGRGPIAAKTARAEIPEDGLLKE